MDKRLASQWDMSKFLLEIEVFFFAEKAMTMYFQVDWWGQAGCFIARPVIPKVDDQPQRLVHLEMNRAWAEVVRRKLVAKYGPIKVLDLRKVDNAKDVDALLGVVTL